MATIPKGTRDFLPDEMVRRTFIFETIKNVFVNHGYVPIETPAIENIETLTGKYGDEGDKLIFRILNSGDYLKKVSEDISIDRSSHKELLPFISGKALRYDLTVPFARFVSSHRNNLVFPFKRYQIQPVWRADNPQKGRYREFFQCDVDVVGSDSLLNELDLMIMVKEIFSSLNLPVILKYNNRKILYGITERANISDRFTEFTIALDKLEKIGKEKVLLELKERGFNSDQLKILDPIFELHPKSEDSLVWLSSFLSDSKVGVEGVREATSLKKMFEPYQSDQCDLQFDITLARGLNYYTGAIFEVKANQGNFGSSICGGGRYDDLTGIFGLKNVSGVGISFGADRIYDVLLENNLFPKSLYDTVKLLVINFGGDELSHALQLVQQMRENHISCELYPDPAKLKKQIDYAAKKGIMYVLIAGSEEIHSGKYNIKNIVSGDQIALTLPGIIQKFN